MLLSQALDTILNFSPKALSALYDGASGIYLKNVEPYQPGFKQAALYLTGQLSLPPRVAPGRIPQLMNEIMSTAESFVLSGWRQRHYPRAVKKKPQRYPPRHS